MALIELNLSAKSRSLEQYKLRRRREMNKWRKIPTIYFDNDAEFALFQEKYNWKKRPVEKYNIGKLLMVKFLDYKPPKKKQ